MMSSLCQTTRLKVVSIVWLISWICLCRLLYSFSVAGLSSSVFLLLCPCLFSLRSWGNSLSGCDSSRIPLWSEQSLGRLVGPIWLISLEEKQGAIHERSSVYFQLFDGSSRKGLNADGRQWLKSWRDLLYDVKILAQAFFGLLFYFALVNIHLLGFHFHLHYLLPGHSDTNESCHWLPLESLQCFLPWASLQGLSEDAREAIQGSTL